MRGEILSYDTLTGSGLISGDDGVRYAFQASALQSTAAAAGARVDFVPEGDTATQIMILAAAPNAWAGQTPAGDGIAYNGDSQAVTGSPGAGFDFATAMFSFNGRLRRSHFWIGFAIIFGASLVANFIPFLGILISLGLIWPNLAISVKRLHDMGKSGWFVAIPYGIGIVLGIGATGNMIAAIVANGGSAEDFESNPSAVLALMAPAMGLLALSGLIGLAFLIWIGAVDSQPGANKYGPNPKGE